MVYFAHNNLTRRVLVSFLDFLSRFTIEKYQYNQTTGEFESRKFVRVPIQYASKEEWLQVLDSTTGRRQFNPALMNPIESEWILPRLSANIVNMTYDSNRKVSSLNRVPDIGRNPDSTMKNYYMPVPYSLDLDVYAVAKSMDDILQITEQMVPFFSPSMSMDVKLFPDAPAESIPVVLQSTVPDYPDEIGSEDEIRLYQMTFGFQIRMNYYLPRRIDPTVKSVVVDYELEDAERFARYVQTARDLYPVGEYKDRPNLDLNPVDVSEDFPGIP